MTRIDALEPTRNDPAADVRWPPSLRDDQAAPAVLLIAPNAETIAPLATAVAAHLVEHGIAVMAVTFGVDDDVAAVARAGLDVLAAQDRTIDDRLGIVTVGADPVTAARAGSSSARPARLVLVAPSLGASESFNDEASAQAERIGCPALIMDGASAHAAAPEPMHAFLRAVESPGGDIEHVLFARAASPLDDPVARSALFARLRAFLWDAS